MSNPNDPSAPLNDPSLQRFTATGRLMPNPKGSREAGGMAGLNASESFGHGAPNLLPVKFTDESIISIAVVPPPNANPSNQPPVYEDDKDDKDAEKEPERKSRFGFSSFRRKSSSSAKKSEPEFVMKDVTRGDYLKYYAKNEKGKYIGTERPARDCILNNKEDIMMRRNGKFTFNSAITQGNAVGLFMGPQ